VAKVNLALVVVALASVFASAQSPVKSPDGPGLDFKTSFVGSPVTCSQAQGQTEKIIVPSSVAERAKLRARLVNLLRESLFDEAHGIVNIAREKEIKKLANKIRKEE
jgi:hypothetical protein